MNEFAIALTCAVLFSAGVLLLLALFWEGSKVKKEARENPKALWGTWEPDPTWRTPKPGEVYRLPEGMDKAVQSGRVKGPSALKFTENTDSERKILPDVPPSEKPSELKVEFKSSRGRRETPMTGNEPVKKPLIITDEQRAALKTQEEKLKADYRAEGDAPRSKEGLTLEDWLQAACARLIYYWGPENPCYIREMIIEELEVAGMKFPDPEYEWTLSSAWIFAEEINSSYGESYGSNT